MPSKSPPNITNQILLVPSDTKRSSLDNNGQFLESYATSAKDGYLEVFAATDSNILTPKNSYSYMMVVPSDKISWDGK